MRLARTFLLVVFLPAACQPSNTPKMPIPAYAWSNATAPALLSPLASSSPPAHHTFTDADFARHLALLKRNIKRKLTNANPKASPGCFFFCCSASVCSDWR